MSNPLLTLDPTDGPFHPTLEETAARAAHLHANQVDKAGQPYFLHLVRVSRNLRRLFPRATKAEYHAAWLHDTLEDTDMTEDMLRGLGYAEDVIRIVKAVTRIPDDPRSYAVWIAALAESRDHPAIRVKIADLTDNSDPGRLSALPNDTARSLGARYQDAIRTLADTLQWHPPDEDDEEEQIVPLVLELPQADYWIVEEAARLADRDMTGFVTEEIVGLSDRIVAQGSLKDIKLDRDYVADSKAFIEAFTRSERKHGPIREWAARQAAKDKSDDA